LRRFADSPELFASTCANLIARMLDTVPREVELTEIITPLRVKPQGIVLSLAGDTLKLSGEVRVRAGIPPPSVRAECLRM
jgi:hypothetical protein